MDKWILVEMGETRKAILADKLPDAQRMAEKMKKLAIEKGFTLEEAEAMFTLRIMEESVSN